MSLEHCEEERVVKEASVKAQESACAVYGQGSSPHCRDKKGSVEPGLLCVRFRIVFIFHRKEEERRGKIT